MEIKARLNDLRISDRKARLVVNLVRNLKTDKALAQLSFINKKSTNPIAKLIKSAIANAVNNYELDADNLYVKAIRVDQGKTLKRWMPRAHGRATTIRKRSCHIDLILAEIKDSGKKEAKKAKAEKPVKLETLVNAKAAPAPEKVKVSKKQVKDSEEVVKEEDPRNSGRRGHAKMEGSGRGFASRMFNRKSG
jgi:large subunit ribosomal protein L22